MKKALLILLLLPLCSILVFAQIDKEQLALTVSKADAANTEKLKAFIWKRYSTATVNGAVKATTIMELKFDEKGALQVTQVGGESSVKQKPGLRGKAQENAIEEKTEYVEKALKLSIDYTYMSKGELLDFFEKATITESGGVFKARGANVLVKGDSLTVLIDAKTNLFIHKKFKSTMGADPIDGEMKYGTFSSGISHVTTTLMNMPAQKAKIDAENKDYAQRVN